MNIYCTSILDFLAILASQVRVLLEQGDEKTVLWTTNGQDTDKWVQATVYVLRIATSFRVREKKLLVIFFFSK